MSWGDRELLDIWRVSVTAVLAGFLATFRQRFGFEPGANAVGPPASGEAVASLAALRPAPARDLLTFYESIGEVSLPDVGNGYFIHSPRLVIEHAYAGGLRRIGAALRRRRPGLRKRRRWCPVRAPGSGGRARVPATRLCAPGRRSRRPGRPGRPDRRRRSPGIPRTPETRCRDLRGHRRADGSMAGMAWY